MIALVQRVASASVTVNERPVSSIGPGLLILLGIHRTDTPNEVDWVARKVAQLRIFRDDGGLMNRSLIDIAGEALVVSQFTLYGDARKGNRPSFIESAAPEIAEPLYESFSRTLAGLLGRPVSTGEFGAMMDVALVNDGPVTLWIERKSGSTP